MRRIRQNSIYDVYCISRYLYQCYSNNLFGVVLIAQLVEVTDNAVLGGVVEVVSSYPTVGHENIFKHFPTSLIYYISPYIYLYIK